MWAQNVVLTFFTQAAVCVLELLRTQYKITLKLTESLPFYTSSFYRIAYNKLYRN